MKLYEELFGTDIPIPNTSKPINNLNDTWDAIEEYGKNAKTNEERQQYTKYVNSFIEPSLGSKNKGDSDLIGIALQHIEEDGLETANSPILNYLYNIGNNNIKTNGEVVRLLDNIIQQGYIEDTDEGWLYDKNLYATESIVPQKLKTIAYLLSDEANRKFNLGKFDINKILKATTKEDIDDIISRIEKSTTKKLVFQDILYKMAETKKYYPYENETKFIKAIIHMVRYLYRNGFLTISGSYNDYEENLIAKLKTKHFDSQSNRDRILNANIGGSDYSTIYKFLQSKKLI